MRLRYLRRPSSETPAHAIIDASRSKRSAVQASRRAPAVRVRPDVVRVLAISEGRIVYAGNSHPHQAQMPVELKLS